ncbi:uncharacterized protein LOC120280635 isoform X2 [Dioscorea cayenensis subsp. rotundata]|uniref:Uncharacterized protein LOC120280635 isoform X2 n=1 Tax=Dioscorea cayennensis subsp. rotundata TaxID=55577 RepID=A0AB40CTP7_DIOCR|nr:uncharacterized protein LOC120280635 isoform X2 [Dioscorea cayenensis subsp. rotundata]
MEMMHSVKAIVDENLEAGREMLHANLDLMQNCCCGGWGFPHACLWKLMLLWMMMWMGMIILLIKLTQPHLSPPPRPTPLLHFPPQESHLHPLRKKKLDRLARHHPTALEEIRSEVFCL